MLCVQISDVTDKILPRIEDWQNRPLDEVYPILYIDAIHYSVRDNGVIRKLAAYKMIWVSKHSFYSNSLTNVPRKFHIRQQIFHISSVFH